MRDSLIAATVFYSIYCTYLIAEIIVYEDIHTHPIFDPIASLLCVTSTFCWFIFDSKERSVSPSGWLKVAVLFVPILGIPYYKLRHYGVVAALKLVSIFLFFTFVPTTIVATLLGHETGFG